MMIEAYVLAWNEAETIHLTIQHYQKFCSRIVIYDNFSTDDTRDIAVRMGCEVRLFGIKGVLSDKEYLKVKNHCWKESKADWVIVCDSDEILWHPNISEALKEDCTIMTTYGWNVYSEDVPREMFHEITSGYYDGNYSKSIIFNPKALKEINYGYGCHVANPKGDVRFSKEVLTIFHYRNIGGYERLSKRHQMYRERLSEHNRQIGLGIHYMYPETQRKQEWYEHLNGCGEYVAPGGSYCSPQIQNLNSALKFAQPVKSVKG